MGYAKEKEKVEREIRKIKRILLIITVTFVVALVVFSAFYPPSIWKYYVGLPKVGKRVEGEMRIHFIDVGQGDATLIELPDGKIVLIDGGDATKQTEKQLLRHLNALKIKTIDYMVVTHADSDHCGGLAAVLAHKTVKRVYLPKTRSTVNEAYAKFYAAVEKERVEEGCKTFYANRMNLFDGISSTEYKISFLYPYSSEIIDENESNNASAVVWLDYRGVSALFTGDATLEVEEILLRDENDLDLMGFYGVDLKSTEILKVSHHGSRYATSAEFIEFLGVETAVISCGKDNAYNHPSETVLNVLKDANAAVYRTDTQGSVIITVKKDGVYTAKTLG